MQAIGSRLRYGAVAQTFHWVTVVLVVAAYLLGAGGPESRVYGADRAADLRLHETLGMLVLVVVVIRLIWRFFDRIPDDPPMPGWMSFASRFVHWVLYAMLLATPLTAIIGAWLEGHPVTFLGTGDIGPWLALSHDTGRSITQLHTTLGSYIVWLAGLHALAALFHHFVLRDRVLLAMLPAKGTGARLMS